MRDFVYVKDCVARSDGCCRIRKVNGLFNVGTGVARSFLDLVHAVGAAVGRHAGHPVRRHARRAADKYQYFTQADIAKLRAAGFDQPFHSLEDGVRDYVQSAL